MESNHRTLYIDALTYKKNKAHGYNEYLFNLLDYLYNNREKISYAEITIICEKSQVENFKIFSNKFKIKCFSFSNLFKRIIIQSIWNFLLPIKQQDTILFTANYSTIWKRCNQVLVVHDLLFLRGMLKSKLIKYQRKLLVPLSLKKANKIIAISEFTKNDILNNYKINSTKIEVIYNYFNFKKFHTENQATNRTKTIISIASASPHKNTICILKAFLNYKIKGGKYDLQLIGKIKQDTPEYEVFLEIKNKFPDSISNYYNLSNQDLGKKYSHAEVYVSASLFEGLGMPIVESMYFGLILVLPSTPSIFREVSNNSAIFFESNNHNELSNIFSQIENHKIAITKNYDLARFDSSNTSELYISCLNKI